MGRRVPHRMKGVRCLAIAGGLAAGISMFGAAPRISSGSDVILGSSVREEFGAVEGSSLGVLWRCSSSRGARGSLKSSWGTWGPVQCEGAPLTSCSDLDL
jgi:hypothetical protein